MAPHYSTLAWKIPWTEEPGRLQSMGPLRAGHDWVTSLSLFTFMHWRRKWQPTPAFLPGESQGWEAWWAAVYGVTQSRTRLKRLSSSSSMESPGLIQVLLKVEVTLMDLQDLSPGPNLDPFLLLGLFPLNLHCIYISNDFSISLVYNWSKIFHSNLNVHDFWLDYLPITSLIFVCTGYFSIHYLKHKSVPPKLFGYLLQKQCSTKLYLGNCVQDSSTVVPGRILYPFLALDIENNSFW